MKSYSFFIPVSQTDLLEVSTRLINNKATKFNELISGTQIINNPDSEHVTDKKVVKQNSVPEDLLLALHAMHQSVFQIYLNQRSFMVATATGYQMLHLDHIVCFEYIKERKSWDLTLMDGSRLQLKRNTNADDILSYSLKFVRINQQVIINLDYLKKIEDNVCRLSVTVSISEKLNISRNYMKILLERVEVI